MSPTFGIIRYRLPPHPATTYVKQALSALQAVESAAPRALPVFLRADSVLTLSGVRAYDAYNTFYAYLDDAEIRQATDALAKEDILLFNAERLFTIDKKANQRDFEICHRPAFLSLWEQYDFPIAADLAKIDMQAMHDDATFLGWSFLVERLFGAAMDSNTLPRSWLTDWRAPQHLRFGLLLGYPGKALESEMWIGAGMRRDEEQMQATIHRHDAYLAAHPIYHYDKSLKQDPEIMAHQQLWSAILDGVYGSAWHKTVEQSASFKTAYVAAKKEDQGE